MEITKELKQKLIMVVDDAASMRNMLKAILREFGFDNIFEASNGKEAQKILEKKKLDMVICDWNMPVMSGLELFKAVKKDASLKDMAFIMLTAESQSSMVKEAFSAGITDYIVKPFTADVLMEKVVSKLE